MATKEGLSDKVVTVSPGEEVSWVDVTGQATGIIFPDVQGAPILKEFVGREVHVYFDRQDTYRYTRTLGTKQGTREIAGEITVQ